MTIEELKKMAEERGQTLPAEFGQASATMSKAEKQLAKDREEGEVLTLAPDEFLDTVKVFDVSSLNNKAVEENIAQADKKAPEKKAADKEEKPSK